MPCTVHYSFLGDGYEWVLKSSSRVESGIGILKKVLFQHHIFNNKRTFEKKFSTSNNTHLEFLLKLLDQRVIKMNVGSIMIEDPVTISIPNTRKEILKKLISENVTGIPVVKRDGELVGLITRRHLFENPNEEQLALLMQWDIPKLSPTDNVKKAAKIFMEKRIFHICVVRSKKLVGFLRPYELLRVVETTHSDRLVEEFLGTPCIPIWEGTPLPLIPKMIKITDHYAMPILNDDGNLSGIITDRDLFTSTQIEDVISSSELGLGEDEDSWTWEGIRNIMTLFYEERKLTLPNIPVKDVMVKDPTTVYKKSSIAKAARLMRKNYFGQLPVTDSNDKLVSMIYNVDLLRGLME